MWLAAGLKIAQVGMAAFQMVERSKTTEKNKDKTTLALGFAQDMLGGCSDPAASEAQALIQSDPEVREKFNDYAKAYVALQNAIVKKRASLTAIVLTLMLLTPACAARSQHFPLGSGGGGIYFFVYSCTAALGCAGEEVEVVAARDGWVRLADGRMINLANVLVVVPRASLPPPPPPKVSPSLRVENLR